MTAEQKNVAISVTIIIIHRLGELCKIDISICILLLNFHINMGTIGTSEPAG